MMQARQNEDERVSVLARRQSDAPIETALEELWRDVTAMGWLGTTAPRIQIQIGQRWRSSLVVETAHSLARHLAAVVPAAEIELCDPAATSGPRSESSSASPPPSLTVHGLAASEVRVPESWFSPFFLVTVTGAGPDPSSGFSAVLDAQAESLARLDNALPPVRLAYEAHRLSASDLVVACLRAERDNFGSAACWFVGPSDVGVEMALLHASGVDPMRLPYIKTMAEHEILPRLETDDGGCRLRGYLAPAWLVRVNAARARFHTSRQALVQDVVSVRRNLHRVPLAIQRRLAMWRRSDE